MHYTHEQLRQRDFRGPDFFLVRDVAGGPRNSWVVWEEGGRYPDLIVELPSDSTARVDRTDKKTLYQNAFRTPEYFWFWPITGEFAGFRPANRWYEAIPPDERGWRWSDVLGLYLGVTDGWLRYFAPDGTLVLGPTEAVLRERQQAEQERQRAGQERQRAEYLAQRLRDLGIDPDP